MKQTLLGLAFLLAASLLSIAPERASIVGTVTDAHTGEAIPGANVAIVGTVLGAITDVDGKYEIPNVRRGTHTVMASFVGYTPITVADVRVRRKATEVRVDFALVEGVELNEVVVEYERPLIQKDAVGAQTLGIRGGRGADVTYYVDGIPWNTEEYATLVEAGFQSPTVAPLSTFSIDVDAASYANVRRFITSGQRPPIGAVRIEEFLNYFSYEYDAPRGEHPIAVSTELGGAPWKHENRLLRIGVKGATIDRDTVASNLVFLIDVSGSMRDENKLPLLKKSFVALTDELTENDRVAIVVYAGAAGLVLESTRGDKSSEIRNAIERLQSGGSTAGAAGIRLAYNTARANFIEGGNNRVILATDGDFNVGVSSTSELDRMIEEERESGVFLTVLGFGVGNLKDSRMESLANKGNGNYFYIDRIKEGRRVLVDGLLSTMYAIAKDVKIQVEFNPQQVASYRLIGYENRRLESEDFNDDRKDAGEMGAGHTVTALYEIVPASESATAGLQDRPVDPLRYQVRGVVLATAFSGELATVKVRYKDPDGETSRRLNHVVKAADFTRRTSNDQRFAAAVATFGMVLRESEYVGSADLDSIIELAGESLGRDAEGYRSEFVDLVRRYREVDRKMSALE